MQMKGTIKSLNLGQVYYNDSWDFCRFSKSIPILDVIFQNFKKAVKFDIKCPFRKVIMS